MTQQFVHSQSFSHKKQQSSRKKTALKKVGKTVLTGIIGVGVICVTYGAWRFHKNVLSELPDVSKIQSMVFSQANVITDRNGKVLYRLFEENRKYVKIDKISNNMINAIVAIEDQRYREHGWLDPIGIIRAWVNNYLLNKKTQGASTIPQQLVKNLLLTNDKKLDRKLKEVVLTMRLWWVLEKEIIKEKGQLGRQELRKEIKNKTLELYLNYISFGNNAFGVEAAAQTYFNSTAKDLTVLQAAILSSLPKWPSAFDPFKKRAALMGKIVVTDMEGNKVFLTGDLEIQVIKKISGFVTQADLSNKKDNSAFTKFIKGLLSFTLSYQGKELQINYTNGRKDDVLSRMYEDNYITEPQLKEAFIQGLNYQFEKPVFPILAPHFVHWIEDKLTQMYDKETILKGGLVIKTTLDYDIQKIAEQALNGNVSTLKTYGATNSSMIYLDSKNGDVIAYVGSLNYFDETIDGQVDIIRSARQIGSTMKPFIYALGFMTIPLTIDTPIYDIPFRLGKDEPGNADDKFMWLLTLQKALGFSRNIPAIKMIEALGGEAVAKPFLQSIGFTSLSDKVEYGYPLAIGAGETPMLELANAYMHLSAAGKPGVIDPIMEIKSSNWSILYQKTGAMQKQVIPSGVTYLIWKILSDPNNMVPGWAEKYRVPGLSYARKTGTSNMKTAQGDRARDGWLAIYTPSKVVVFWAGNADGKPMNRNAFWGTIHAQPFRTFFSQLRDKNYLSNETFQQVDTTSVVINKLSGRTPTADTPDEFRVSTLTYNKNPARLGDKGMGGTQVDKLCYGAVGPYTPQEDIRSVYVRNPVSFMPDQKDAEDIKKYFMYAARGTWTMSGLTEVDIKYRAKVSFSLTNIIVEIPKNICEERQPKEDSSIKIDILKPTADATVANKFSVWYSLQGTRNIKEVIISVDDVIIKRIPYTNKKNALTDIQQIDVSKLADGGHTVSIRMIDAGGYSNVKVIDIVLVAEDEEAPVLLTDKIRIKEKSDWGFEVTLLFEDTLSSVVGGKILQNGLIIGEFNNNLATINVDTLGTIGVSVVDAFGNVLTQDIDLTQFK